MNDDLLQAESQFSEPHPEFEPDDRSAFDRYAEVLSSPAQAFSGLGASDKRTSIILWGLVIGVVVNLMAIGLWSQSQELKDATMKRQMEVIERAHDQGKMDNEGYKAARSRIDKMSQGLGVIEIAGVVVGIPISWIIAAVCLFIFARLLGSSSEEGVAFSTAWSAYMLALLIPLIGKLIVAVAMYFTGNIDFSFSAAALVHSDNAIGRALLKFVDPFEIWWVFVLGTGLATIANVARAKGIALWAVFYVIVTLGFATLSQLMGGMFG